MTQRHSGSKKTKEVFSKANDLSTRELSRKTSQKSRKHNRPKTEIRGLPKKMFELIKLTLGITQKRVYGYSTRKSKVLEKTNGIK